MNYKKSLLNNSIYNVLYKLLNVFFPLVSATYVSHVLLAKGIGMVASAQNVTQYFVLIAALGIPNYGTREIAKVQDEYDKKNKLFSELFFINMISTSICIFAYYILIFSSDYFFDNRKLYVVTGMLVVFNFLNIDWFYQGIEEYKYIATRSAIIKIIMLLLLVIFVHSENDYIAYAYIYIFATAGNYILNVINLKKNSIKIILKNLEIKRHLKPVFYLLCTTIAIELYTLLDTTMISFFCEPENVAYYTNSIKIVRILITVVSAIGGVLLPRLSHYREKGLYDECSKIVNKIFYIMLFVFLPSGIGLIIISHTLQITLFGQSFEPSVVTLQITSLLVYTLGFSNLFGTQILLTFENEKKLFLCTLIGATSNIIMNAILIPLYQQNGAAIASVISESLVTLISFYYANKLLKIKFEPKIIYTACFSCFVMTLVLLCIKNVGGESLLKMIVELIIGGVTYIVINVILKNPIIIDFLNLIEGRVVKEQE